MRKAGLWLAVLVGVTTLIGAAFTFDGRYAKAQEMDEIKNYVEAVQERLDLKILKDRATLLQERIWAIQDKFGYDVQDYPEEMKIQYRDYKKEHDDIMEKIKKIIP